MRRYHLFILYGLIVVLFGAVTFLWNHHKVTLTDQVFVASAEGDRVQLMLPDPKVRIFEIPDKITFAGEQVPLQKSDVFERFEREIYVNAYWQSNMILMMKRSAKYLPTIEKILREQNIPDDFKYLVAAESGFMNVVSPAGARGFWQLMPATAKEYGLEVNNDVDERYHLEKSTIAACKYIKSAYANFGNWTSVAASYNMGVAGLKRRKDEQKFQQYYDLFLNDETSRYIFRILAFKVIFENPEKYGFELEKKDYYQEPMFRELKVMQSIPSLAQWALRHNSSYKEVKTHNPWLRSTKLSVGKNKEYFIKLPI
ncbi:lytic transglycosylase domain-containing protein [Cecembia lonarensis]|uniref:Membrane-bound lytic murein transglycosylase D n=1 Tax=Cecembia lonarensis (strain CCUG 58316 / KCTC 22772 / LW9) TaxID=1225176 RepID=K1L3G8_CECL9|nr:lytic transglycosylase domain-containing protein [Cecembia lonarensis]EKB49371.1 Membrane-bound lytic murein transglycosylase D precursor [Cecembia lonarensis LW9]